MLIHGLSLVQAVAYYAMYRGLEPGLTKFLRMQAKKNAAIAIGIDVQICRPSTHRCITARSLVSYLVESMRDIAWYLSELFRGHIIIPTPIVVAVIYVLRTVLMQQPKPKLPYGTAADLFRVGWPEQALAPELMATYLRFIALEDELYGLSPYDGRYITLCLFSQIYSSVISWLFRLAPPAVYISIYSGYIQHYIPCHHASKMGAPVLVLGCTDCLYRIDDSAVPRQFLHLRNAFKSIHALNQQLIAEGQNILRRRINGQIDSGIEYMPSSPFVTADSRTFWQFPRVAESLYEYCTCRDATSDRSTSSFIVVFMHELQDWHHNGVLPPFASSYYEWLLITVKFLLEQKLPFVIKIHPAIVSAPNRYRQTVHALCCMTSILNTSLPISTTSSTLELIEMGMDLGLTVRGTIGLELAYLGTQFLCAGTPPYGSLFPRRTELDLHRYLHRLLHFRDEPKVSFEESAAASYYVGLQHERISLPDVHLQKKALHTSPDADFIQAKKYL